MAKKHRVKRQKYVEHLLELEKSREEYLEKRRAPKRTREARNNEEVTGEGRDAMESTSLKKRRTESTTAAKNLSDEEGEGHHPQHTAPARTSSNASAKTVAQTASLTEKGGFFKAQPVADAMQASAATLRAKNASEPTAKKSLKRRHY